MTTKVMLSRITALQSVRIKLMDFASTYPSHKEAIDSILNRLSISNVGNLANPDKCNVDLGDLSGFSDDFKRDFESFMG